jgi:hypothetical protein
VASRDNFMNYSQTFRDTIHILQTTKLAWLFGLIALLPAMTSSLARFVPDNLLFSFIYILASFVILCFSLACVGGFIYVVYQKTLEQKFSFSDVWFHSKINFWAIFGSSFPVIFLAFLTSIVLEEVIPNSSLHWYITFIGSWFMGSAVIFSICAIMINNVKAMPALWTGFLIALRIFFHVLIIACTALLIRALFAGLIIGILRIFEYSSIQKIMGVPIQSTLLGIVFRILMIPISAFLTLAYLKFTEKISYPALSNQQNTT